MAMHNITVNWCHVQSDTLCYDSYCNCQYKDYITLSYPLNMRPVPPQETSNSSHVACKSTRCSYNDGIKATCVGNAMHLLDGFCMISQKVMEKLLLELCGSYCCSSLSGSYFYAGGQNLTLMNNDPPLEFVFMYHAWVTKLLFVTFTLIDILFIWIGSTQRSIEISQILSKQSNICYCISRSSRNYGAF